MQARQTLADIQHLLTTVLKAPTRWQGLAPFADTDGDLAAQVLDEAAKFVDSAIAPLQRSGDEEGCRFDGGQVHTPAGFRDAYQAFWQAGWPSLSCAPDDGGQGLPAVLECVLFEWLAGANHGWTMAPGLLHGAYECIKHHASDELKAQYLEKVATGEWLATMCLTEPQAGSDLGLCRTRALPQADGSQRAIQITVFAESQRGLGEGFRPWDRASGGTMTNATIDTTVAGVDGQSLRVKYKDGEQRILVPQDVTILAYAPGERAELKVGAHLVVPAIKRKLDGSLGADRINVGRGGVIPR